MHRRTLLAAAAAATATGIAGCLADAPGSRPGTGGTTETTDTPSSTPAGPRLVDRSFEVVRVECGDDHGGHEVTQGDGVVTVEGTLDGSNGCYTAELVTAEYDEEPDQLTVEVEVVDDSGEGEACPSCIVEIDYVAEFTFEDGEPSSIRVEQRGASGGSASASESVSGSGESTPPAEDDGGSTATDA